MTREEEKKFKQQVKNEIISRRDELMDAAKRNAAIVSEFIKGAEYADQNPRKGLWDAEKVCDFIKNSCMFSASNSPVIVEFDGDELVRKLREAMKD